MGQLLQRCNPPRIVQPVKVSALILFRLQVLIAVFAALRDERTDRADRVRRLISDAPTLQLSHADADGYSLLHALAQYDQPQLLALLIEKGLFVGVGKRRCIDATDRWGVTALMLAAVNGHAGCSAILLRNGADRTLQAVMSYPLLVISSDVFECVWMRRIANGFGRKTWRGGTAMMPSARRLRAEQLLQ